MLFFFLQRKSDPPRFFRVDAATVFITVSHSECRSLKETDTVGVGGGGGFMATKERGGRRSAREKGGLGGLK